MKVDMSDNKKYYYLKIKENFFESEEIIILQNMSDGYLYSDILMKLYLRSLKSEGKLMFKDRIPYNSTILSQVVRHNVGVVEKALNIFKEIGLVEILDNGAIYMLDIQNYIGTSSSEADRQREYYNKIKNEQKYLTDGKKPCKKSYKKSSKKSTPEIEIELETELEIKKDIHTTKKSKNTYCDVVLLTDEEYKKLVEQFGKAGADDKILNLSLYIQSKGNKYKSHYATILNWERKNSQNVKVKTRITPSLDNYKPM